MRILLSRTDSIGDVVLSLPMAGFIKEHIKNAHVDFLGRTYTKSVIEACDHVDSFVNWDDFKDLSLGQQASAFKDKHYDAIIHVFPVAEIAKMAKRAGIRKRIGTTGRLYLWFYCNALVKFSRRRSELHESQLNLKLLKPLGIPTTADIDELVKLSSLKVPMVSEEIKRLIVPEKFNLILHPKSKGSAIEWGLENFNKLIAALPEEKFHVFISGTNDDKKVIGDSINFKNGHVTSLLGKMNLVEFIGFISLADGLVAASTGPLHIAAALGKKAIGLYSPRKPIHPGRWAPIGADAHALVFDPECPTCKSGKTCHCIEKIEVSAILGLLEK